VSSGRNEEERRIDDSSVPGNSETSLGIEPKFKNIDRGVYRSHCFSVLNDASMCSHYDCPAEYPNHTVQAVPRLVQVHRNCAQSMLQNLSINFFLTVHILARLPKMYIGIVVNKHAICMPPIARKTSLGPSDSNQFGKNRLNTKP
jgi:hypothetical protein